MRSSMSVVLVALSLLVSRPLAGQKGAVDLSRVRMLDLSHPYNARTLFWPTSPTKFKLDTVSYGQNPGGWFYSAFSFSAPEHGGTHLDAPIHFAAKHLTADRIPLERLIAPAIVIDVSSKARVDRDYRLTPADISAWEKSHGRIPAGVIVLLRTGWDARWPDAKTYLGDDTPGDASKLHFPSYGADAAKILVSERKVAALGADVASIDYGPTKDFMVHRVAMAADVYGLENLTGLARLPATGATIIALPMKIEGGSGGPVRVVALVAK